MTNFMVKMSRAAPCLITSLFIINALLIFHPTDDSFTFERFHETASINNNEEKSFLKSKSKGSERYKKDQVYGEFILDTPGCKLKNFNPYDESIEEYVYNAGRKLDCQRYYSRLTYKQGQEIFINKSAIPKFLPDLNHCAYYALKKNLTDDNSLRPDLRIKFNYSIVMFDEFVHIECYDDLMNVIYDEFYWQLEITNDIKDRKKFVKNKRRAGKDIFNILVIGIDSTSRLNKIRQLPMTSKYINDNFDVIDFKGFLKVEDNTFPNLIPLLTGNHEDEDPRCFSNRTDSFDKCPFLWHNLVDRGYVTMHGEDRPEWGSFNFERPGFDKSPVDFYLRPLMLGAMFAGKPTSQEDHCVSYRSENGIVLDYLWNFVEEFKNQAFFGFSFTSGLSHNSVNTLQMVDHEYLDLFSKIKNSTISENTFVFFLSDHGSRFGEIRNTRIGHHEDSTPFLNIIIPKSFRQKYSTALENLEYNADRLVTMFDIHETFMDILYERIGISEEAIDPNVRMERGISLFRGIPKERTCKMAGISSLYCVCVQKGVEISTTDRQALVAASSFVDYLNKELEERTTGCVALHLSTILEAEKIIESYDKEEQDVIKIQVKIEVSPSEALLEAIIGFFLDENGSIKYQLKSGVNRLNMYGTQSWCVIDPILKKFCFCEKQKSKDAMDILQILK